MSLKSGTSLGHYEILSPLGAGGMGEVYIAHDTHLDRKVAIKVLPQGVAGNAEARERFEREAKTLAGLSHPNILTIHDFASQDETYFAVTELLEGEDLRQHLERRGAIPAEEALPMVRAIGRGLAAAHERQIVHRDIKPANVFLQADGVVKVLDFGLARSESGVLGEGDDALTAAMPTSPGTVLGTLGYMSPEQARGQPATPASDVFSFGCLLYEMLTGQAPFQRETRTDALAAILKEEAASPEEQGFDVPADLERVLRRSLEKTAEDRYPSAVELSADLDAVAERLTPPPPTGKVLGAWLRRPQIAFPLLVLLGLGALLVVRSISSGSRVRWARETALPEIQRLIDEGELRAAYDLAEEAEASIAGDHALEELFGRMSQPVDVVTEPPGAEVFVRDYEDAEGEWKLVGTTPIEGLRSPLGLFRWRIRKPGYEEREVASREGRPGAPYSGTRSPEDTSAKLWFQLDAEGTTAEGMVAVEAGPYNRVPLVGVGLFAEVLFDRYLIDRTEVTNREFKEFVDAGGYANREYWQEPFARDGADLGWEEALASFRDQTGRPGPAGWVLGDFQEGQGDYPVGGVSWYEASAYAEFRGKSLPTVFHWIRAVLGSTEVAEPIGQTVVAQSRFDAAGPVPVASRPNIGIAGAYDMAGNLREWTSTAIGEKRYTLGGAWGDPAYFFNEPYPQSPWERPLRSGFRCVSYTNGEPGEELLSSFDPVLQKIDGTVTMSDEAFEFMARIADYDPTPLNASVDRSEELTSFRQEWVTVDAAYGGERLPILLQLPKGGQPPYQAVVVFGGMNILLVPTLRGGESPYGFLVEEGRALVIPVYEGSFERNQDGRSVERLYSLNGRRELIRHWRQDLGRTIDYLEERTDIDATRVAYLGNSLGATLSPYFMPFEDRFGAALLWNGGISVEYVQETVDLVVGLMKRTTTPTLMLGGAYDHLFPAETHQKPMYEFLGASAEDKRLRIFEMGGHGALPRAEVIKESLDWLDRHLGPVEPTSSP